MEKQTLTMLYRHLILLLGVFGSLLWILSLSPIAQDLQYHDFADQTTVLGIANFANVISNLPFVLVGWLGLAFCQQNSAKINGHIQPWRWLFIGVLLTGFGSAYYHWSPDNDSLVWDRLPMTIGFMGLFCGLLSEKVHAFFAKTGLYMFIILGITSVVYWALVDDLRLYYWVQLAPLLSIVILLCIYPKTHSHQGLLFLALLYYILAKVAEHYDDSIYQATHLLSGHSLKHLLAALGIYFIYKMLALRTKLTS